MGAKEKWLSGDIDGARQILQFAFGANTGPFLSLLSFFPLLNFFSTDSEQIWLAAVKLESENKEFSRARSLLERARERSGTQRVWLKRYVIASYLLSINQICSVILERELGNRDEEKRLLTEALLRFPNFDKLWMMRAQWEEKDRNFNAARDLYQQGVSLIFL